MLEETTNGASSEWSGTSDNGGLPAVAKRVGASAGVAAGTATNLAHNASDYVDRASEVAGQAKEFVTGKVTQVGERIRELGNKDLGELAENAKSFARKNPGQAILISAAAGLLLGLLVRGRR